MCNKFGEWYHRLVPPIESFTATTLTRIFRTVVSRRGDQSQQWKKSTFCWKRHCIILWSVSSCSWDEMGWSITFVTGDQFNKNQLKKRDHYQFASCKQHTHKCFWVFLSEFVGKQSSILLQLNEDTNTRMQSICGHCAVSTLLLYNWLIIIFHTIFCFFL